LASPAVASASTLRVRIGLRALALVLAPALLSGCAAFSTHKEVKAAPDWFRQRTAELSKDGYHPKLESVPAKPLPTRTNAQWAAIAQQLESDYVAVTASPRSAPPPDAAGAAAAAQNIDTAAREVIATKAKTP
jgi:hypothetical protein